MAQDKTSKQPGEPPRVRFATSSPWGPPRTPRGRAKKICATKRAQKVPRKISNLRVSKYGSDRAQTGVKDPGTKARKPAHRTTPGPGPTPGDPGELDPSRTEPTEGGLGEEGSTLRKSDGQNPGPYTRGGGCQIPSRRISNAPQNQGRQPIRSDQGNQCHFLGRPIPTDRTQVMGETRSVEGTQTSGNPETDQPKIGRLKTAPDGVVGTPVEANDQGTSPSPANPLDRAKQRSMPETKAEHSLHPVTHGNPVQQAGSYYSLQLRNRGWDGRPLPDPTSTTGSESQSEDPQRGRGTPPPEPRTQRRNLARTETSSPSDDDTSRPSGPGVPQSEDPNATQGTAGAAHLHQARPPKVPRTWRPVPADGRGQHNAKPRADYDSQRWRRVDLR
jgi:hypothetical protein